MASSLEHKEKKITRYFALLAIAVSVFYLFFDFISEAYGYLGVYFILLGGSVISLILLKKDRIVTAKIVLMLSAICVITAFASVESLESGIYFYYLVVSLGAFTLFGYRHLFWTLFFVFLSIGFFILVYFTNFGFIPSIPLSEEYIRSSLLVNYIVITIATSVMMFYLIKNNYEAEEVLLKQRSDLTKTTEELERSQRRFELAIKGSSAAIWDWDIKSDTVSASPKLSEILQRPFEQIQGSNQEEFAHLIHPDDLPEVREKLNVHFKTRKNFEAEFRLKKGDGNYLWVLDTGQAEWDRTGNPVRMVGTMVDIHEKKLAVERVKEQNIMLAKANQELDRFVYSTSHDLRAPLSSLLGLINLAKHSTEKEERDKLIEMMQNQIMKLDSYIQDITDYSRNARVDVEYSKFNILRLIEEAIDNLRYMEGADKINISINIDENKKIRTDKERFKVIINNLISNAIKYRDPEKASFLRIEAESIEGSESIIFSDNGIGIEEEHLEKIFNMFYRASDKSRGSGLGLYIAKEFAEKINAMLSVESKYGEGTIFRINLPSL